VPLLIGKRLENSKLSLSQQGKKAAVVKAYNSTSWGGIFVVEADQQEKSLVLKNWFTQKLLILLCVLLQGEALLTQAGGDRRREREENQNFVVVSDYSRRI